MKRFSISACRRAYASGTSAELSGCHLVEEVIRSRRKKQGDQALLRFEELRTVLIISDDTAFRKQLRALFDHGSGFDVCEEARNGVEALDRAKSLSPNLVVLDFLLPDMSGLELAEKLKANKLELPILMLTTDYSVNIEKTALSLGHDRKALRVLETNLRESNEGEGKGLVLFLTYCNSETSKKSFCERWRRRLHGGRQR